MKPDALPARLFPDHRHEPTTAVAWERLLEDGTGSDLQTWLADRSRDELHAWLATYGDRLSARSWAFWRWLLPPAARLPMRRHNPYWPDAEGLAVGRSDGDAP